MLAYIPYMDPMGNKICIKSCGSLPHFLSTAGWVWVAPRPCWPPANVDISAWHSYWWREVLIRRMGGGDHFFVDIFCDMGEQHVFNTYSLGFYCGFIECSMGFWSAFTYVCDVWDFLPGKMIVGNQLNNIWYHMMVDGNKLKKWENDVTLTTHHASCFDVTM